MITERLMKPGNFDIRLAPDCPTEITRAIELADSIVITPTPFDSIKGYSNANILATALYHGVITSIPDPYTIEGYGILWWAGSPEAIGQLYTTYHLFTNVTLGTLVAELIGLGVMQGITAGTTNNTSLETLVAGPVPPRFITGREILDFFCQITAGEYRINPACTIDTGHSTTLFVNTPKTVVTRRGGGNGGGFIGVDGTFRAGRDIEKYATTVYGVLSKEQEDYVSEVGTQVYRDLAGDLASQEQMYDGTQNVRDTAATLPYILAKTEAVRRTVEVSSNTYALTAGIEPGDYAYIYDEESGLLDTANQIAWQGETISPIKLRVFALTWPVQQGMGVYVRRATGTGAFTYTDLTPYVMWEGDDDQPGETTWEVGAPTRAVENMGAGPGLSPTLGQINYLSPNLSPVLAGRYMLYSVQHAAIASNTAFNTTPGNLSMSVSVTGCVVGDIIEIEALVCAFRQATADASDSVVVGVTCSNASVIGTATTAAARMTTLNSIAEVPARGAFTVTTAGTCVVNTSISSTNVNADYAALASGRTAVWVRRLAIQT